MRHWTSHTHLHIPCTTCHCNPSSHLQDDWALEFMTFTAASIFPDKILILPRHVSRLTLCRLGPDADCRPPRVSHLPLSVLRQEDGNSAKNNLTLSHMGYYLLLTLVSTEFWLFFSHIVDIFCPTVFLPPLSHQIIGKSTQFIYLREVEAPVRMSWRSHSDVYFYSQVYLTLKPQNNLFIYPAVAKVHNNTLREPLSLSAGMHWPVVFEGWSPRKEMTIMFRS